MSQKTPISQEEFDLVLEENVVEFGMSEEDALQATLQEFKARDLSNVATSASAKQMKTRVVEVCSSISVFKSSIDKVSDIVMNADDFTTRCLLDHGALGMAMKIAVDDLDERAFKIVSGVCDKNVFARDVVPREGLAAFCKLLREFIESSSMNSQTSSKVSIQTIQSCLSALQSIMKGSEINKRVLNEYGFAVILSGLISLSCKEDSVHSSLFLQTIACVSGFLRRDDNRKTSLDQDDFGRGRKLGEETNIITDLVNCMDRHPSVIAALQLICVSDKACAAAINSGIVEKAFHALHDPLADKATVFVLLRTLCLNDAAKARIGTNQSFTKELLDCLRSAVDEDEDELAAAALGCLEMVVLRQPTSTEKLAEQDAIPLLIRCLKEVKDLSALKYALRALRNMLSSPENHNLRQVVRDAGGESVCRDLAKKQNLAEFVEACLRDMGVDNYHVRKNATQGLPEEEAF